uniref:Uncharacterized protein n=1 Tax=Candidatus Kentrum sp. FM TaxID=2126340 RepID=A0A450WJE6_9GAMM|nr:MAG: hypothetical protein BECKFM1743C_GA0114222_103404 [Candidatus Kentron sp. FM]VFJ64067.1 MAG: hypothetical protein BECKFM1743A_GA0114220_103474 [Candidatus Kentron sp. FM]VFK17161.1 MAG: hypothetical protein BECKFM1743B_GA0114221_104644 [Candidatus Kentron sp. FM]
MNIDGWKVIVAVITVSIAGIAAYLGQPLIHGNEQAIDVITTVFSVLAGFLVAIIAVLGDPMLLPPGTWRAAEMHRKKLIKRLIVHKWLFLLYLITLALVFSSLLLQKQYPVITLWLERTYLFFGVIVFILSIRLPGALMKLQEERIDAMIEHRREQDGIVANKRA